MIILFLFPIYICSFKNDKTTFFKNKNVNKSVIVHIKEQDLYLDLDDYLVGVVSAEMPALFQEEAIKAQAVAARSFVMSKEHNNIIEISSTISDQVYYPNYELSKKWQEDYNNYYKKISLLVNSTKDLVVKRNGKILRTYYFSMSNGYTENSMVVFNDDTFESVASPLEKKLANYEKKLAYSEQDLCSMLDVSNINIGKIVKNETNHVERIVINDKEYSGVEIRKLLKLRSTDFDIVFKDNLYEITTRGYGHGVGMSQYGANEMAKLNKKYDEILNYYYKNTKIEKI